MDKFKIEVTLAQLQIIMASLEAGEELLKHYHKEIPASLGEVKETILGAYYQQRLGVTRCN